MTVLKLQKFELETLHHRTVNDLAPTDYQFFLNLKNFLSGKIFNSATPVKTAFQEFMHSRNSDFYSKGIKELSLEW